MINKRLYDLLRHQFNGHVAIYREDEAMECEYETIQDRTRCGRPPGRGGVKKRILPGFHPGEEFHVSCPYCTDTRGRLAINHRWGVFDEETGTRNLWLAHCWNEECLSDYGKQKDLYDRVWDQCPLVVSDLPVKKRAVQRDGTVQSPGATWRVNDILVKQPWHSAVQYLQGRLLDPEWLGRAFGVSYCSESSFAHARHRIVAPVYYGDKLVTWQARYLGDPVPDGIPKWYTCPGSNKSLALYNVERAAKHKTIIVVEGPGDVWGVGLSGVAVMGKTISPQQLNLLAKHYVSGTTIAVMLDPVQSEKEKAKGQKHQIEKVYEAFKRHDKFRNVPLLKVYLPSTLDPGSADREYSLDLIRWYGRRESIAVSFGLHKKGEHAESESANLAC